MENSSHSRIRRQIQHIHTWEETDNGSDKQEVDKDGWHQIFVERDEPPGVRRQLCGDLTNYAL